MSILPKLKSLDKMVTKGKIVEAFDMYFDEEVVTHSETGDRSKNKAQKRKWLKDFFKEVQKVEKIKLHGHVADGNITHSQFSFHFKTTWDKKLVWNEIIRRTWKNGLVIDEYYYEGELPKEKKTKKAAPKKPAVKKATPKKAIKKATTKKITKKSTPKKTVTKAPVRRVVTRRVVKTDDLKKIEGIGPKIAEILNEAGISTFAKLATTTPTKIKTILAAAGNRYKMHDPRTWPKQSKLAKEGKWDSLKKLQDKLKGGK